MQLCVAFGLLAIVVALNFQPWYWKWKYLGGLVGLVLIGLGLSPYLARYAVAIPIAGTVFMIIYFFKHWGDYLDIETLVIEPDEGD